MNALLPIGVLCLLLIVRVPMVICLAAAVMVSLVLVDAWMLSVPQTVMSSLGRFTLISLPLFVLAGALMNAGGISGRLFEFARSLVGCLRGGLAHVDVLLSIFFGGMVGTSTADIAGTGTITIPALKKHGYPPEFAAAVTASSSGVGPLIPPSNPMILYSAVTGMSLGALFIAGLIPGILLGLSQMAIIAYLAKKRGWQAYSPFLIAEVLRTGSRALLSFGMPAIIVAGLAVGIFTPTEAGAFGAVYALVLSTVVYRALTLQGLYRVMGNTVQMTGEILVIVGLSFALGWALTNAHVPDALVRLIDIFVVGDSEYVRILALCVLAIIAGMVLDPLIPVLLPVILPILLTFNIDLLHFGVLMVVCVVIGQVTPPMAIALIISGRIAGVDQMRVFAANTPFLIGMVIFLLVLIGIPEIATFLPSLLRN